MSENPYTPNTPSSQPGQPEAPASSAGAYAAPGQYPYQDPYAAQQQPNGKKPKNVVGLVALGLGVLGFILACIPAVAVLGWLLLFAAFVTGIVGLFQKNKEKVTSIIAIALSVIGSVISGIVLFFFALNTIANDSELQQSLQELESAVASPTATAPIRSTAPASPAAPTTTTPATTAPATTAPAASSAPSTEASQQTNSASSDVPRDYSNALSTANRYLSIMDFSYAGLYEQLTSEYGEKFSPEAAQYAMDNLNADWNAEALGSAQNYIDIMPFSYAGLYDQLTSEYGEQFTPEQAQYAVDNVKADWNAEALESARNYLDTMDMSTDRLYDQLISEYGEKFTPEQAQYAIDNL
ncbi:Ltp family lipoprotein [Rothia sp. 11254D007CT]